MPRQKPAKAVKAGRASNWVLAIFFATVTVAALIIGRAYGKVSGKAIDPKIIAWSCAAALLIAGVMAATRLSRALSHLATRGSPAAGGAVRVVSGGAGYLLVLFGFLAVLEVQAGRLLVGAGVVGVVIGIAGQQSLGNVFAGLVLIFARPFSVGDRIRVRSGALGGIFEGWVTDMSLTYVTLRVDGSPLKIPNSVMLAVGVGRLPLVSADAADGGGPPGGASAATVPGGAGGAGGTGGAGAVGGAGAAGATGATASPGASDGPDRAGGPTAGAAGAGAGGGGGDGSGSAGPVPAPSSPAQAGRANDPGAPPGTPPQ